MGEDKVPLLTRKQNAGLKQRLAGCVLALLLFASCILMIGSYASPWWRQDYRLSNHRTSLRDFQWTLDLFGAKHWVDCRNGTPQFIHYCTSYYALLSGTWNELKSTLCFSKHHPIIQLAAADKCDAIQRLQLMASLIVSLVAASVFSLGFCLIVVVHKLICQRRSRIHRITFICASITAISLRVLVFAVILYNYQDITNSLDYDDNLPSQMNPYAARSSSYQPMKGLYLILSTFALDFITGVMGISLMSEPYAT